MPSGCSPGVEGRDKASRANIPNGELLAGIGLIGVCFCFFFCWFQKITSTKGGKKDFSIATMQPQDLKQVRETLSSW